MEKQMRRDRAVSSCSGAYFTVEAALVMPLVIACIVLVIYMWFYQYDRCLLEMDTYALAMRSAHADADNNDERLGLLQNYLDTIYWSKYAAWNVTEQNAKIEKGKIYVEQSGSLRFPFVKIAFWSKEDNWSTKAKAEADILNPVFTVRRVRQIKGGK